MVLLVYKYGSNSFAVPLWQTWVVARQKEVCCCSSTSLVAVIICKTREATNMLYFVAAEHWRRRRLLCQLIQPWLPNKKMHELFVPVAIGRSVINDAIFMMTWVAWHDESSHDLQIWSFLQTQAVCTKFAVVNLRWWHIPSHEIIH